MTPRPLTPLPYHQVRERIQTGDLLLYRGTHWVSQVIRQATGSPYSHAGLVTWWSPADCPEIHRLMVLEATHPRVTLRPASESVGAYRGVVDWFPLRDTYRQALDSPTLLRAALERLGLEFSVAGLFDNLAMLLGLSNWCARRRSRKLFCSEFVSECVTLALEDPVVNAAHHFTSPQALSHSPLWTPGASLSLPLTERQRLNRERRQAQQREANARRGALPHEAASPG